MTDPTTSPDHHSPERHPNLPPDLCAYLDRLDLLYRQDKILQCSRLLDSLHERLRALKSPNPSCPVAAHLQASLTSPAVASIQSECEQLRKFQANLRNTDGWNLSYDGADTKVWYRPEPNSTMHAIRVEGTIHAPLINIAALLYEADLYHQLFWYVVSSSALPVTHPSPLKRAVHISSIAPWPLHQRDVTLFAFAVDALDAPDHSVMVVSRSITPADPVRGVPPSSARMVRASFNTSGFELRPVRPGVTRARFLYNVDPHLPFVPPPLINWASRTLCRWSLRMLEANATDIARHSPPHVQRMATSPVYARFRARLDEFWAASGVAPDDAQSGDPPPARRSSDFDFDHKPEGPNVKVMKTLLAKQISGGISNPIIPRRKVSSKRSDKASAAP